MSLATWPDTLPYDPDMDNFVRKADREQIVNEYEDGPDLMRPASSTKIVRLDYGLLFTDEQLAIFDEFVDVTLNQGNDNFIMSVPLVARTFSDRRCYFLGGAGAIDQSPLGQSWLAKFTLCVFRADLS